MITGESLAYAAMDFFHANDRLEYGKRAEPGVGELSFRDGSLFPFFLDDLDFRVRILHGVTEDTSKDGAGTWKHDNNWVMAFLLWNFDLAILCMALQNCARVDGTAEPHF